MLQNKQSTANPLVCLEPREVHNITGLLQIKNLNQKKFWIVAAVCSGVDLACTDHSINLDKPETID